MCGRRLSKKELDCGGGREREEGRERGVVGRRRGEEEKQQGGKEEPVETPNSASESLCKAIIKIDFNK